MNTPFSSRGLRLWSATVLVLSGLAFAPRPARAATRTWAANPANGNWATGANWGGTAPLANDSLVFGGSSVLTHNNNLAAGLNLAGLTFNNSAGSYTISGNAITLGGNLVVGTGISAQTLSLPITLSATRTITVNSGTLTLGGAIGQSTTSGLNKAGVGTLVLSGANTYTGVTTLSGGGTVQLPGATGSLSASSGLALGVSGNFSGAGGFTYDNAGATGATAQTLASLATVISLPNEATVRVVRAAPQAVALTFTSVASNSTENGNSLNFVLADPAGGGVLGTDYKIVLADQTGYLITKQNAYFNGGDFAVYDTSAGTGLSGFVRGIRYGVDANSATSAGGASFGTTYFQEITGNITAQTSVTLGVSGSNGRLRINGPCNLTFANSSQTLTFTGSGNTGAGGIIKTGGGVSTLSGGARINWNYDGQTDFRVDTASDALAISMPVTFTIRCRLMKSGDGILVWNGETTYNLTDARNALYISGGVMEIGGSAVFNDTAGPIAIAPGALFRYNSSSLASVGTPVISGAGGVTVSDGRLTLSGANTFSGQLTVDGGTLAVPTLNNASTAGTLGNSALPVILGKNGGSGTLRFTAAAGTYSSTKPFTLAAGGTGVVQLDTAGASLTLSGAIGGDGGLTKTGPGTLVLSGPNTYTGQTLVSEGAMEIGGNATLNAAAGPIAVAAGALLRYNSSSLGSVSTPVLSGAGGLTVSAGRLTLSGANSFSGQLTVEGGTLAVPTLNDASAAGPVGNSALPVILGKSGGSGTLQFTAAAGAYSSTKPFNLAAGGTGVVQVDAAGASLTLSGLISGDGGLTKTGPGTLILSGANTYAGQTLVTDGTLAVAGPPGSNATGPGTVTVGGTGRLTGGGQVAGLVLDSGGTLNPGTSPGTLTAGDTTWAGGANYQWEINQASGTAGADPGWDLLNISGNLAITATTGNKFNLQVTSLTLANAAGPAAGFSNQSAYTWRIASVSGSITGFAADKFNVDASGFTNFRGGGTFAVAQGAGGIDLVFTPHTCSPSDFDPLPAWLTLDANPPSRPTKRIYLKFENPNGIKNLVGLRFVNCTMSATAYGTGDAVLGSVDTVSDGWLNPGVNDALRQILPDGTVKVVAVALPVNPLDVFACNAQVQSLCGSSAAAQIDPVMTRLEITGSGLARQSFDRIPAFERYVSVENREPGLRRLEVVVNGQVFPLQNLRPGESRLVDVGEAMTSEEDNRIELVGEGDLGAAALVTIADSPVLASLTSAPAVHLALRHEAGRLILSWPLSASAWVLQRRESMGAAGGWSPVSVPPVRSGGGWQVELPGESGQGWFRLVQPDGY